MKNINNYIQEKLKKINSKNTELIYNYFPKNRKELEQIVKDLINKRGNEADLNDIDTSEITDMSYIFMNSKFNGDISKWDVSNVKDMTGMFYGSRFNGDISKWDVSNVEDMYGMFNGSDFNGDISKLDVSKVKNMNYMFKNTPLEKNPPKWYKK
jgi:surface protein